MSISPEPSPEANPGLGVIGAIGAMLGDDPLLSARIWSTENCTVPSRCRPTVIISAALTRGESAGNGLLSGSSNGSLPIE